MIPIPQVSVPPGYRELIRNNPNFRFLWFSQISSDLGDWFNLIASASLIGLITQSGLALGALYIVRTLAPFIASPFGGVIADRYNRRNVIIIANLIRTPLMFGFLLVRGPQDVWLLYTLTAVQLFISGILYPARMALLPDTIQKDGLGTATALTGASFSMMFAIGSALGGFVAGWLGIYPAFMLNGFTYLISIYFVYKITLSGSPLSAAAAPSLRDALYEYLEGLRYILSHRFLIPILLHKSFIGLLLGSTFEVVLVAITGSVFTLGEGGGMGLGLIFAFAGAGLGLGPILFRKWTGDRMINLSWAVVVGYLIGFAGLALTATLSSWFAIFLGNFLRGVGNGVVWLFTTQMVLMLIPPHVRGRVVSTEYAFSMLVSAGGAALVGASLDTTAGIQGTAWVMSWAVLIPAVLWALWNLTTGRSTPVYQETIVKDEVFS